MSLRLIVEKLIKLYEEFETFYKKNVFLKLLGSAIVQVKVTDTGECFNIVIGKRLSLENCGLRKENIILTGDFETLKNILDKGSGACYRNHEREGRVKLKACNLKGRVFLSRFKKAVNIV